MRKGLFRAEIPGIGECARVDMSAGDAAPYLERSFYELLHFKPAFDDLPTFDRFSGSHPAMARRTNRALATLAG